MGLDRLRFDDQCPLVLEHHHERSSIVDSEAIRVGVVPCLEDIEEPAMDLRERVSSAVDASDERVPAIVDDCLKVIPRQRRDLDRKRLVGSQIIARGCSHVDSISEAA